MRLPLPVLRQISILDMRPFGSTGHAWQLNTSFASFKTLSQTWPLASSLEISSLRYSVYVIWLIENTLVEGNWSLENVIVFCLSVYRHGLFSLSQEHSLRAVRYLPDILALLRLLTDRFHRRIDRDKASQLKIRELLQEFPKGFNIYP